MHQTARLACPSESVQQQVKESARTILQASTVLAPSPRQQEVFAAGPRYVAASSSRLDNAIYFADLVQFQEAYAKAAFNNEERAKLIQEFRAMTPEQQWSIVDNADDMARGYRRQKDQERAAARQQLYANKQKADRPAPPEPARVGDGKRRYFDE